MNWLEQVAYAQGAGAGGQSWWPTLLFMGGIFVIFYFLLIRPQSKRRKAHETLVGSLSRGDEVVMASGIMGVITRVDEDNVSVRVAKNVEVRVQKHAVQATMPKGSIQGLDG